MFRLLYEKSNLEYVHIHVIYRVSQAENEIASQEYVNTYSTRRTGSTQLHSDVGKVPCNY